MSKFKRGCRLLMGVCTMFSISIVGISCSGDSDIGSGSGKGGLFGQGVWSVLVSEMSAGGQAIPGGPANAYFQYDGSKLSSIDGVLSYGAFLSTNSFTVNLLITKKTITIDNEYVGGQIATFGYDQSTKKVSTTWQRDLHRDYDNATDNPEITLLQSRRSGKEDMDWLAVTGDKRVLYWNNGALPHLKAKEFSAKNFSGNIVAINSQFPSNRLTGKLKALVFFDDGMIQMIDEDTFSEVARPAALTSICSSSVNWKSSSNIPEMVVGTEQVGGVIYYFDGSDWTALNGSGTDASALVQVEWADNAKDSQLVAGFASGSLYYKKDLTNQDNWVLLAGGGELSSVINLDADFGSIGNTTYPQVVILRLDGSLWYFNGNSQLSWYQLNGSWSLPTEWVVFGGLYYHDLSTDAWPKLTKDTTDYTAFPDVVDFSSISIKNPAGEVLIDSRMNYYNNGASSKNNLYTFQPDYGMVTSAQFGRDSENKLKTVVAGMEDGSFLLGSVN